MNEFLQQFLLESRELAEQATSGLLALERSPQDAQLLDGVFRALHTLKGGAGIVDFFTMERAVHAAEDVLTAARAGRRLMDASLVGDCLACVDQVLQWLDVIERTGELPGAVSEEEADRVVSRLRRSDTGDGTAQEKDQTWSDAMLARHADLRGCALSAVRHAPAVDSFFLGEDALDRLIALPGLLALEAEQPVAWPSLATADPYRCTLVFSALSGAAAGQLAAHLQHATGDFEVVTLSAAAAAPVAGSAGMPAAARDVLTAQMALVSDSGANTYGHVASAATTAARVLRCCGRSTDAERLLHFAALPFSEQTRSDVRLALQDLLSAPQTVAPAATADARTAYTSAAQPRTGTGPATLRVEASRIDALVRLTGELTIARNALAHLDRVAQREGNAMAALLKAQHAAIDPLIVELQRQVLALRVLPLRVVFQRFPRLVREMSVTLGKSVELQLAGEDTEADKAIIEMLFEPLLHVVRNALDHGVETSARRSERGKPQVARIELRASRQGDRVLLEVADDGNGMDVQRIRAAALERALVDGSVLDAMTDAEVIDLVFAPGFSTAAAVTALSGRGVGMDAVRVAVERVGGRVSIDSRSGLGTTVRFLLPFSVMITRVMSVRAGGQSFGVPLDTVVETIRVPRDSISALGLARAVVVRDHTIPVFSLADMLGEPGPPRDSDEATLVIAAFAGQHCALDVDALGEPLDVILKPLDGLLSGIPGIAGTSVLGDGHVLLVLDVAELLQ